MDDAAVLAQARAGDSEAFRALVERHSRALFHLAHRMTGNRHDSEDVVQETFLKAYRTLDHFDERSQVGSWLYRIAANCAFDVLRARERRERHFGRPDDNASPALPTSEPGPDRVAMGSDVREGVAAALSRMSPNERAAFVLRHFEDRSIREIGQALELDTNAVKQSVFRAVRKAREVLAPLAGAVS